MGPDFDLTATATFSFKPVSRATADCACRRSPPGSPTPFGIAQALRPVSGQVAGGRGDVRELRMSG